MLPIVLATGPLYDFMVGALLGSTTFIFVNGVKNPVKREK